MHELDLAVERLSAGKSPTFKIFCSQAVKSNTSLPAMLPVLTPNELDDFERVREICTHRAYLARSLQRQKHARLIIRLWRYVHIPLACLALTIIAYHCITELLKMLPK